MADTGLSIGEQKDRERLRQRISHNKQYIAAVERRDKSCWTEHSVFLLDIALRAIREDEAALARRIKRQGK